MLTGKATDADRDTDTHADADADAGSGQSPYSVVRIVGSLAGWIKK
jgi:hypothetical protein